MYLGIWLLVIVWKTWNLVIGSCFNMFNLSISPPQTEIVIKPGASFTQAYQITNNSSQTIYLTTQVKQWLPQDNQSQIAYLDNLDSDLNFSLLNSNLNLGQEFILKPNQSQQLVLKTNLAKDIVQQDYYLTFFVNQIDLSAPNSTSASGQIGAHLLVSVSPNLSAPAKFNLKKLIIKPKIKDVFSTLSLQAEIDNQSTYFGKAQGQINLIRSGQNQQSLPISSTNILAYHSRQINCQNNSTCQFRGPFWPGPYSISIQLENYTSPATNFVVLPLSPLAIILFFVTIYYLYSRFWFHQIKLKKI